MIVKIEKYGANWCSPCHVLDKTLEQLSGVEIVKYDIEEDESIVELRGIRNVPVLIYYNEKGEEVTRTVGALPIDKIKSIIENYK